MTLKKRFKSFLASSMAVCMVLAMSTDESFTVVDNVTYQVNNGSALTRDGYKFSGWIAKTSYGDLSVSPGMDEDAFAGDLGMNGFTADSNAELTVDLYAQWAQLDESPAAGDTFPIAAIVMLMLMSVAATVVIKRSRA